MQCETVPLDSYLGCLGSNSCFIFFTSYTLSGLVLPFSSFFMMLETYIIQLHHLSLHSIALVVIFAHLYEMYVGMRSSERLFRLFHVLHSSRKRVSPIGSYYFQHGTKSPPVYITTLTPDKWDRRRDGCVIMQAEVHDQLELSTAAPTGYRSGWENVPNLQSAYRPVLKRIQFVAEKGLTSMIVLFDFLSKRIAPLQHRACSTWMYIGENDTTRLERDRGSDLQPKVLAGMLLKLSVDPSSGNFINLLTPCMPIFLDPAMRSLLLKEMPTLDDIDITTR
jgi:hypothetical protein